MSDCMEVLWMAENMGLYTKGVKDKAEAVRLIREEVAREQAVYEKIPQEWDYPFVAEDITDESVAATYYYQHRQCEVDSIGDDNICYECGETCGTNGRRTFAFIKP